MGKDFLLEIGTEELPTDSLDVIESRFQDTLAEKLREARLTFQSIRFASTPRRQVLFVAGLADKQESHVVERVGPSWDKAYDGSGQATEALKGFLRSKKLSLVDVVKQETPRGFYAVAKTTVRGKQAEQILPGLVVEALKELPFPKAMRWDHTQFNFPRPIRWILALLNNRVMPLALGAVRSDRFTRGHRFLAPGKLSIARADWGAFKNRLRKAHVMVDAEERKQLIRKGFGAKAGKTYCDEELVHTTAQLVEEPFLVRGSFDRDFLTLPSEILSMCMKKNQRIFAVYDAKGRLKPEFVAVLNGKRTLLDRILKDYREVLEARLRDARFFYAEDTKEALEKKVGRLKGIIFLGKLGTMHDKVVRMQGLAQGLAKTMGLSREEARDLERAATLCKADLLTQMVYEFPELQGVMGREYARVGGESDAVSRAVADHYLPRSLSQPYTDLVKEQTRLGSFLAILEKVDTLVGAFGIGLEPTGSQDPYALRRAGGGIVKILRAFRHRLELSELIRQCVQLYGNRLSRKEEVIAVALESFFKERVAYELSVRSGSMEDQILKAVLKTSWGDVAGVFLRFDILKRLYDENPAGFQKAHKVIERTHNILKGIKEIPSDVKRDLLKEPLEKKLYELVAEKASDFERLAREEKFDTATHLYGETFYELIHEFFDKVLVNVEDPPLRENRRALMKKINKLYVDRVADLSLVNQQA